MSSPPQTATGDPSANAEAKPKAAPKAKTNYIYKLFRVNRADGRITTVSMDMLLVTCATKVIPGGLDEVSRIVKEAAMSCDTSNCSGYCSIELQKAVDAAEKVRRAARAARIAEQALSAPA